MITEIKRTPITWNGEDGWEVLVRDDNPPFYDVCELCMYNEWEPLPDSVDKCVYVHGCLLSSFTYFKFEPL